ASGSKRSTSFSFPVAELGCEGSGGGAVVSFGSVSVTAIVLALRYGRAGRLRGLGERVVTVPLGQRRQREVLLVHVRGIAALDRAEVEVAPAHLVRRHGPGVDRLPRRGDLRRRVHAQEAVEIELGAELPRQLQALVE